MTDLRTRGLRAALLFTLALSGCVPKVPQIGLREIDLDLPDTFAGADATGLGDPSREALFNDPKLVALIDEAIRRNQELGIAAQEINVDHAEIIARRAAAFPTVDLGVDAGVEKVGRETSQGRADEATGTPEHLGDFRIELHASWEIDIWKRLRNTTKAAQARYLSSVEGRKFLITGLVAEVANTWYELEALDRQLLVVQSTADLLREAVGLVKLQQDAARVTALAVQRFEAELYKTEARQFELKQQIVEAENRLNGLVGRFPQPIDRSSDRFLEAPLPPMQAGLPVELLTRRPDIRAAELDLAAAKLDVKAARAAFFPRLAIDARFGIEAFNPAKLVQFPAALLYDTAANLLAPLFNRAEIKADYYAANARQMQTVLQYEQAVVLAVVDVANQVAAIDNTDQAFDRRTHQVEQLSLAIETSNQLFAAARADFLEVLTTRSEALEAQIDLIETRERQWAARVDLYRALGGGWDEPTGAYLPAPFPMNGAKP